jgi:mRNA-degrading endonuclease toxin of MazEF toxin-antitoxin module
VKIRGGTRDPHVLADQLRAVDPQRLDRSHGLVGFEAMEEIDEALLRVLGLDP